MDILVKFYDELKELLILDSKKKKDIFTEFIVPGMKEFDDWHKSYLDSLRNYFELISDKLISISEDHPIFVKIKVDTISTGGLREKVYSYYDSVAGKTRYTTHKDYRYLAESLIEYINYYQVCLNEDIESYNWMGQVVRHFLHQGIMQVVESQMLEEEKRKEILYQINSITLQLQLLYRNIIDVYNTIKTNMI